MEDTTGRYTYSYDALNRSKAVTTRAGKTITYSYDAVGNRKFMLDPDGGRFTYIYDAADRIDHLANPQNERTSYSYDAANRGTVKKLANGTRKEKVSGTVVTAGTLPTGNLSGRMEKRFLTPLPLTPLPFPKESPSVCGESDECY